MAGLQHIDDKGLVIRLEEMALSERRQQIEILCYLAELDERRVVVEMGYSGMWDFCRRHLKFSEGTSTRRVNVARASKKYPDLLKMLEDGRLNLGTASDLAQVLTDDNCAELLTAAAGKTAREVQRLVDPAQEKAAPRRDVIRRVASQPAVLPAPALAFGDAPASLQRVPAAPRASAAPAVPQRDAARAVMHRVSFTADEQVVAKLERLQEILGGATLAAVCDRAADLLLDKVDRVRRVEKRQRKAKSASAKKPASRKRTAELPLRKAEPRRPPTALADQIVAQSGMRCSYVSKTGVPCTETRYLTIDHVRPYALGGKSTDPANLRRYCSAHNLLAGRHSFGAFNVHSERRT